MARSLNSWSWQNIYDTYKLYGTLLASYELVAKRTVIPSPDIQYSDEENLFLIRWRKDIVNINEQLNFLDKEIARRNKLIGVI